MGHHQEFFDVVGVGFGPANIAVAIALEELNALLKVKFLESGASTIWQKGMLFDGSDIQNHPLRDLVTPSNPRSKYTFTNYLFENNRLFQHLNLGMYFPFRLEYAQYVEWVSAHFEHMVNYNTSVAKVTVMEAANGRGIGYEVLDNRGNLYKTRSVILATGRTPYIPRPFTHCSPGLVRHITGYQEAVDEMIRKKKNARICVVGSSQSAVEAILHLGDTYPEAHIIGVLRSFGYRLKDTSPFTGEVYFPEFVDLFYGASSDAKRKLAEDLYRTNYGSADGDVLDRLYRKIYVQQLRKEKKITIHRSAEVLNAGERAGQGFVEIRKLEYGEPITEEVDLIILATGFKNIGRGENEEAYPPIVESLIPHLQLSDEQCIRIGLDYRVKMKDHVDPEAACFLNGLCESSHGMGDAGSFSLLSLRSRTIVRTLLENNYAVNLKDNE